MTDWFKKMTPEEAAKFRIKGVKFMVIPFSIIIIIAMIIVFSTVQKSSNKQKLADSLQNNSASQTVCHKDLQQCGSGCIPSNAVCCDKTIGNSYCLWPDILCKTNPITNGEKDRFICSNDEKVKSYDCPTGQVFCGIFCIDIGKKCCFGDVCKDTSLINDQATAVANPNYNSKKNTNEQFIYGGELTINANFEKDNNIGEPRWFWHSSAKFSTIIHFSNLVMSSGMERTDSDGITQIPVSEGNAKLIGTYTSSCSDSGTFEGSKDRKDSISGEIVDSSQNNYGGIVSFQEIFNNKVKPSERLGIILNFASRNLIPYKYRETWCSSADPSAYLSTILEDVLYGTYGNKQRIANIYLQKTGYISDSGETIQFSGIIEDTSQNLSVNGTTYTGIFKIYRE